MSADGVELLQTFAMMARPINDGLQLLKRALRVKLNIFSFWLVVPLLYDADVPKWTFLTNPTQLGRFEGSAHIKHFSDELL